MNARLAANGDTVNLRYALRLQDSTEILSNFDDPTPHTLTLGDGTLAQNLEQWLIGIAAGERHVFLLEATQAFGASQPELVHTLCTNEVMTGKPLQIGSLVEFTQADGETLAGQILAIEDDTVKVDFNHPLADFPIEFEVEVINILESAIITSILPACGGGVNNAQSDGCHEQNHTPCQPARLLRWGGSRNCDCRTRTGKIWRANLCSA